MNSIAHGAVLDLVPTAGAIGNDDGGGVCCADCRQQGIFSHFHGHVIRFCLIAEGKAQIYPSLGPTSEWDSAGGQAIVEAAGGVVVGVDGKPLTYNQRDSFANPPFYALADIALLPAQ